MSRLDSDVFDSDSLRLIPWSDALFVVTTFLDMSESPHLCRLMARPFQRMRGFLAEVLGPEEFLQLERRISLR